MFKKRHGRYKKGQIILLEMKTATSEMENYLMGLMSD